MARLTVLRLAERVPPLPGGKEVHAAELTRAQHAAGHDVHVLYRFGNGARVGPRADRVALPWPLSGVRGLPGTALFAAAAARRARLLTSRQVVHVHGDLAEAAVMSRYARRAGSATVLTVHAALNPRYARLSRPAFAGIDAFIALGSRAAADLLRCGVAEHQVTVMSSGLNFGLLTAAHGVVSREPGLVVAVGSLDPMKNIQAVIESVCSLPDSVELTLEIIGDGPERDRLQSLAGGNRRVRFRGAMSRPEVYRRVAAADAFVIASRRLPGKGEGVPTALLEAMALGRLALVSTQSSPAPVISDPASYLTFAPDDNDRLRGLLVTAVTDPRLRARVGERARAAVAHLGWPQVAQRVDDVYANALRRNRMRSGQRHRRGGAVQFSSARPGPG
jgi:glycosyltransferase involved in cell wall biosynthesis